MVKGKREFRSPALQHTYDRYIGHDPKLVEEYEEEVINAIKSQNLQAPVGRIGARPISNDQQLQLNIQTKGRLSSAAEFEQIALRSGRRRKREQADEEERVVREIDEVSPRDEGADSRQAKQQPKRIANRVGDEGEPARKLAFSYSD